MCCGCCVGPRTTWPSASENSANCLVTISWRRRAVVIEPPPTEELDVCPGNRPAGDRVGPRSSSFLPDIGFSTMAVSSTQRDDEAGVSIDHLRAEQIGAGRGQRRRDRHATVEMALARVKLHLPLGHLTAEILFLVPLDEPIAEVGDVGLLPIEISGIGFQYRALTSPNSFSTLISWATKSTWRPLRKRYSTDAPRPAGCARHGSKRPHALTIWSRRCCQDFRLLFDSRG